MERQAIDALARGDRARATGLYMQLAQLYPQNRAFAEAARILRGGLPPMPEAPTPGPPPTVAPNAPSIPPQ